MGDKCLDTVLAVSSAPFSLAQVDRSGNEDTHIVDKRFYSVDSHNKDDRICISDCDGDNGRPYNVFPCAC